jgi:hypothetical protein
MLERLAWLAVLCAGAAAGADTATPAPSDRALLEALESASRGAAVERARAARWIAEVRSGGTDEALAAAARGADADAAARLVALRARLRAAWRDTSEILSTPWPVDPRRACRPQALALRQAMAAAGGAPLSPGLTSRVNAQQCLDRLSPPLERLRQASRALHEATLEARTALEQARPATGAP